MPDFPCKSCTWHKFPPSVQLTLQFTFNGASLKIGLCDLGHKTYHILLVQKIYSLSRYDLNHSGAEGAYKYSIYIQFNYWFTRSYGHVRSSRRCALHRCGVSWRLSRWMIEPFIIVTVNRVKLSSCAARVYAVMAVVGLNRFILETAGLLDHNAV